MHSSSLPRQGEPCSHCRWELAAYKGADPGAAATPTAAWRATDRPTGCALCSDGQRSVAACLELACNYGLAEFQKKCCNFFLENLDDLPVWEPAEAPQRAAFTQQLADAVPAPVAELLLGMIGKHREQLIATGRKACEIMGLWHAEFLAVEKHIAENPMLYASTAMQDLKARLAQALYLRPDCVHGKIALAPTPCQECAYSVPVPFAPAGRCRYCGPAFDEA